MKIKTIWSIPSMSTIERLRRTRDWGAMAIASKLPLRIRYWVTMLELAHVTTVDPTQIVPEMKMDDILRKLRTPKSMS